MRSQANRLTTLALIAAIVLWATAFVGIRIRLKAYDPGELALLRFLTASLTLRLMAPRFVNAGALLRDRRVLWIVTASGVHRFFAETFKVENSEDQCF